MGELVHQFIEIFGIELSKKMAEFMLRTTKKKRKSFQAA